MILETPQDVINRARWLWFISAAQYTDAKALEDYNIKRQELSNLIMQNVNENYFSKTIATDLVEGQNKYSLTDDDNEIKINKVEEVFIAYTEEFEKADKVDQDRLSYDLSYYNENQNESSPFYFLFWDEVRIYPAAKEEVVGWLKMKVSLSPYALAIADVDDLFPSDYMFVIALGMLPIIYQRRGLISESRVAQAEYESAKTDLILLLSDRVSVPSEIVAPNLSEYD